MATTYDAAVFTDTAAGKRNRVRFYAQDNRAGAMRLQDEEIDLLVAEEANLYVAAARACEEIAGRVSVGGVASKSVGGLSVSYSTASTYAALAKSLRQRGLNYQTPTAGGVSVSESEALDADPDLKEPDFRRGLHDHPGVDVTTPASRFV